MNSGRPALVLLAFAFVLTPAALRGADLVAHYQFEDALDLGLDSSGLDNHALTVTNVTQVAGWAGQGASFDENLPSLIRQDGGLTGFTGNPGRTFAAWVKLSPTAAGFDGIISQDSGGCCSTRILFRDSNTPYINLSAHIDRDLNAATPVVDDVWTHIAMTGENTDTGSEARIYIDGVEVVGSPQTFTAAMNDASTWNTYLGGGEGGSAHLFTGVLDEVRIYEGVLTVAEIQGLLSTEIDDLGFAAVLNFPTAEDPVVLSSSAPGTAVGELTALSSLGAQLENATFTLVPGTGDTDNASYAINGSTLEVLGDLSGLDSVPQSIRVEAENPENTVEAVITFTVVLDSEPDGLIDAWENLHGTTAEFATGGDHDVDGLNDEDEFALGTDPDDADTDDDGLDDGDEIANNTDPFDEDSDDDTLLDGNEVNTLGTNPLEQDTDSDGLLDPVETNTGALGADPAVDSGSDPNDPDTDGDGTPDGLEILAGRDPNVADDPGLSDRLVNYWDFEGNFEDTAANYAGSTSVVDDHGSVAGAIPANLTFATGGLLDGEYGDFNRDAWVEVLDSVDTDFNARELSISMWFFVDGAWEADWQAMLGNGEGQDYRIHRSGNSNSLAFNGGSPDTTSSSTIEDGSWHHVVAVSDSTGRTLYLDGVAESTQGALLPGDNGALSLWIGNNQDTAGRSWDGGIDDVAMWERGLRQDEVTDLYEAGLAGESLGTLLGGGGPGLAITAVSYAPPPAGPDDLGEITITWRSKPGRTYAVYWNTDLVTQFQDLNDFESSDGESTTRTYQLPPNPDGGGPITEDFFLWVEQL